MHINYRRGETRRKNYRRHVRNNVSRWYPNFSLKWYKQKENRRLRRRFSQDLAYLDEEEILPPRIRKSILWDVF